MSNKRNIKFGTSTCKRCGKSFTKADPIYSSNKFCSQECYRKSRQFSKGPLTYKDL
jgi:hypothetical protein